MEQNFEDLWITFQQNVYPAMIDYLAEDLGVTVESIKKLGVGFYPLKQAFIFTERDENGQIIGLIQRYKIKRKTKKHCWLGSKRGLSYDQTNFIKNTKRSFSQNNFIRIENVGVCCPLCGKKDWCLVSDDNLEKPSAVICGRTEKGAVKFIKGSGYLHRINRDNSSAQTIPLRFSNKPLVVVEGSSDVLAAMDMGYIAIGKPSAESGNDILAKLVKNKDVIVVGENDEVGQRGMESTFQTLKSKCKSVVKILPPDRFKDLREWYPTVDEFESWVRKNKITKTANGTFETVHWRLLAQELLKKMPKFVCHESDWFDWK